MFGTKISNAIGRLWSDDRGLAINCTFAHNNLCRFEIVNKNEVIKEWEHNIKGFKNVCFTRSPDLDSQLQFKMLWYRDQNVYCDYITVDLENGSGVETETALTVNFDISNFYILWSQGILWLQEEAVWNLHVFDTGHDRYLGYVTLHSGTTAEGSLLRFDDDTMSLWAIVSKYDEVTKTSSAFLNTYSIPNFILSTSVLLPRGYSKYTFVHEPLAEPAEPGQKAGLRGIESALICSSCDILNKSIVQWYLTPKKPWKQKQLDQAAQLGSTQNCNWIRDQDITLNFQPTPPILELKKMSF